MELLGRIFKDGKFWVIDIPALALSTQGKTRKEALEMAKDAIEMVVNFDKFSVKIVDLSGEFFSITPSNYKILFAAIILRQRAASGLTQSEFAEKLGLKSATTVARYEQCKVTPKLDQLSMILHQMNTQAYFKVG